MAEVESEKPHGDARSGMEQKLQLQHELFDACKNYCI